MHVRPAPAPSPLQARARFVLAFALFCACTRTPPDALRLLSAALDDWASIVLAALPFVVSGALAASLSRRLIGRDWRHEHRAIALLAVLNPGCDCALNGFAGVLASARPALAGFALTFAAAASPASLAVTYAAFGIHMTLARAAAAFIAAALTSAAWSAATNVGPTSLVVGRAALAHTASPTSLVVGRAALAQKTADHEDRHYNTIANLAGALSGVAIAATAAAAIKAFVPAALFAHLTPAGAALLGAMLSPCSTADPLMAAAFIRDAHAQLAFMVAAQCLDVRQLLLLLRHFGAARMLAAAVCAACACTIATTFA